MTFTLWFMGRPAAGKSTLANRVQSRLADRGISVENLDGDEIRQHLHPDLGFSREDRAINNRRTAFICRLLNRNGIPTVTGMITPFRDSQRKAREIVEPESDFILIYVKCSVEEAAKRDPKKLYERAKRGEVDKFTGINHPFQEPHNPDITVDTEHNSVEDNVSDIFTQLETRSVLNADTQQNYSFDIDRSEEQAIKDRLATLGYLDDESS